MRYYYFLSTLPTLLLGKDAGLDIEAFNKLCRVHLLDKHYKELSTVAQAYGMGENFKEYTVSGFAAQCMAYYHSLSAALAAYRPLPKGFDRIRLRRNIAMRVSIAQAYTDAEAVSTEENSYQAEILIMKAIWNFIESLETPYVFAFENVVAYCVKLWAVHRDTMISKERGEEQFASNIKEIMATH